MMQQPRFDVKVTKRVMLKDIFDFDIFESCDGGVSYAPDTQLLNLFFIFLFLQLF